MAPGAAAASFASQQTGQTWNGWLRGPRLQAENEALKAQVQALRVYQYEAEDAVAQLKSLQSLVDTAVAPGIERVYGRIIGYFPNERRLTLNVGSKDGVVPNRAVISAEGLAGVVDTVSPDMCQVLLVTSASTRIGGKVVRAVTTYGLVRGLTSETLTMEAPSNAPIETGDLVVTSGISEWVRGNIPVGEVTQITPKPEFGTKQLTLFPSFKLSSGRYLAVLK